MSLLARLAQPASGRREALTALVLGAAGFGLNTLELQLGWGMHFVFGNALVFAFLRTMRPPALIAAASISSLWTAILWNHPWAWMLWTLEAAVLALMARRTSPILVDVLFWLIVGAPLLLLTYGFMMDMDRLSLWLVIAKQAANGVLNVTLGELIYLAILSVTTNRGPLQLPRMPIGAFVTMLLTAVILIPTTVFLALDAPEREDEARKAAARRLDDGLIIAQSGLDLWFESRTFMLRELASELNGRTGNDALPAALQPQIVGVAAFDATGTQLWTIGRDAANRAPAEALDGVPDPVITSLPNGHFALVVPPRPGHGRTTMVATVAHGGLKRILVRNGRHEIDGLLAIGPDGQRRIVHSTSPELASWLTNLPDSARTIGRDGPELLSSKTYGNALMSDLLDTVMARTVPIQGTRGWVAVGVSRLSGEVLKARAGQAKLLVAVLGFVVLVVFAAALLSRWIEKSLRRLAQSAANLALAGTKAGTIYRLVISELSDVSINISTAGSRVAQVRGALATYQRRLESIAEHAPVVVCALGVRNERAVGLTYVSKASSKILGYTPEEMLERTWWWRAVHPDDVDRMKSMLGDLHPGQILHLEFRLRHRLGHYLWVYGNLAIEADPVSHVVEGVGLLMDISERKFAAEQLVQAEKMASLGRMVAGIAHELNQPLNFVKMAAMNLRERINRGMFAADVFNTKLDAMIAQVDRASAIILQMRVFGRKPSEMPRSIAVVDVVDAVLTMIRPQLDADGIRIHFSETTEDLAVRALPVLLEQVLLNLLLNAHDAIRARQAVDATNYGRIDIIAARRGGRVIVTVEDNGTGLREEAIPVLFEPFFTTKPPKEGTGLGLSISYGIIRDLGGTIRAENTLSGARFVIELPADG